MESALVTKDEILSQPPGWLEFKITKENYNYLLTLYANGGWDFDDYATQDIMKRCSLYIGKINEVHVRATTRISTDISHLVKANNINKVLFKFKEGKDDERPKK